MISFSYAQFKMEIGSINKLFTLLLLAFLYEKATSQSKLKEGECILDSGKVGHCINVGKCPEAITMLRARRKPKICGFVGRQSMVCCEIKKLRTVKKYGQTAIEKCSQYNMPIIPPTLPPGVFASVGGLPTLPGEFPHMVSLGYGNEYDTQWLCAGSLVSENFVLTAAHCAKTRYGPVYMVKTGLYLYDNVIPSSLDRIRVKNIYKHPQYTRSKGYHDIALLKLEHDVSIGIHTRPACLYVSKELPNDTLVATGWGASENGGDIQNALQKVILKHVPFNNCASFYRSDKRLPNGLKEDWQLCADGGGHRRDTCQGDSGGPIQAKYNDDDNVYTIVGITSLGIRCAIVPSVYTRVSNYIPWIESTVWGD